MEQLVQSSSVLPSAGTLSDQGGVSSEDHTFSDTPISLPTDFSIVELEKNMLLDSMHKTVRVQTIYLIEWIYFDFLCSYILKIPTKQ